MNGTFEEEAGAHQDKAAFDPGTAQALRVEASFAHLPRQPAPWRVPTSESGAVRCGLGEMAEVERVLVHGPVLAAMYHAAASSSRTFDGILFGRIHERTVQRHQDAAEAQEVHEHVAVVSSFINCTSLCSFYNAAGEIHDAQLNHLAQQSQEPVLGWCCFHTGPQMDATMRETCVTQGLPVAIHALKRQNEGRVSILFKLAISEEHNGATVSFSYRSFQVPFGEGGRMGPPVPLRPVPVEILNVGSSTGGHRYGELWPPASCKQGQKESGGVSDWARVVAGLEAPGLQPHIKHTEEVYEKLLKRLEGLAAKAQELGVQVCQREEELEKWKRTVPSQ
eukprot:evm.model.scf_1431.3 EVM.evm.TU.scf_1431.3   scf_1431:24684-26921(-)